MNRPRVRRGFSLIEMLVVAGIVAILGALLLPAVQAAREAARRAQCSNNLRQLALGVQNYLQAYHCHPPNILAFPGPSASFYSWCARILPYIEQRTLFDSINFSVSSYPDVWLGDWIHKPDHPSGFHANLTSRCTPVSTFLCPGDGGDFGAFGTNYRGNAGKGSTYWTDIEFPDSGNGSLPEATITTPANFPDGLSHTVLLSERLRGSGGTFDFVRGGAFDPARDVFGLLREAYTAEQLLEASREAARPENRRRYTRQGEYWFWAGRERTSYNHAQAPNGIVPDGMHSNIVTLRGMSTARSRHFGGVNVAMADGSGRFVRETIDLAVWKGLGTRNGGELVD